MAENEQSPPVSEDDRRAYEIERIRGLEDDQRTELNEPHLTIDLRYQAFYGDRAFSLPSQSWGEFYEKALSTGQGDPKLGAIAERWDLKRWVCLARPSNGTSEERSRHIFEIFHTADLGGDRATSADACPCGRKLTHQGFKGIGLKRAYFAYLAGLMSLDEAFYFQQFVIARQQEFVQLAVVPMLQEMIEQARSARSSSQKKGGK